MVALGFSRSLQVEVVPHSMVGSHVPDHEFSLRDIIEHGFPSYRFDAEMRAWKRANLPNLWRGLWRLIAARTLKIGHLYGQLCLVHIDNEGQQHDYGLVSLRVITTAGAAVVANHFTGTGAFALVSYNFHALGTGGSVESASDTALSNELHGYYATPSTRIPGAQTIQSTVIYKTLASVQINTAVSITEHGIFSQAAAPGGTLLDRSLVSPVPILSGNFMLCDYRLTVATGV